MGWPQVTLSKPMTKKSKTGAVDSPSNDGAALVTTGADRAKATEWFKRARELGEKRQFDYAIEYYVDGLAYWPDAVEEACKPLHGCGVARKQTGGKKPGLKDTMKRSMTDKDPKQAFLNSMWLFGHEPDNLSYLEGVARNAGRLRAESAAQWAGGVLLKALDSSTKSGAKQFGVLVELSEGLGDRAAERGDSASAIAAYQTGIDTLNLWRRRLPRDQAVEESVRDLSTKLTILKGKYKEGESYRDSMVDSKEQKDLHDEQRTMQSDDRVDELILRAEEVWRQNQDDAVKLKNVIDLLCRREREDQERKAIGILVEEYKRTGSYRWKHLADDIRMKQLGRRSRELAKTGNDADIKEQQISQLRFELNVFKERTERYPTDNRVKYEYAVRTFRAGRFDDAIPLFQAARADPKNRTTCGLYLGRCFYKKAYYSQAIAAISEALAGYETTDDDLAKSMLYWLGRAQEAGGETDSARKTYGRILQLDYNYKDVRVRLDELPS